MYCHQPRLHRHPHVRSFLSPSLAPSVQQHHRQIIGPRAEDVTAAAVGDVAVAVGIYRMKIIVTVV